MDITQRLGTAPRVNLLPSWVAERRLVRRQRLTVAAGFGVALCLLALLWLADSARAQRAERAAAGQRAIATQLGTQRAGLQPWADLQAEVVSAEQLRATVYAREVRFSRVLQDVAMVMPDNAWLTQLSASLSETQQSQGSGTQPSSGQNGNATAGIVPGAPGFGSPVSTITFAGAGLGHIRALEQVRSEAGSLRARAREARDLFPAKPDLPDLTTALQKIAEQSGVDLVSIQPTPPAASTSSPELAALTATVSVGGGFFAIEDFLARLENLVKSPDSAAHIPPRSVLVRSVSVAGSGSSGGTSSGSTATLTAGGGALTANISLMVFQHAKVQAPGAAGTTTPSTTTPPAGGRS